MLFEVRIPTPVAVPATRTFQVDAAVPFDVFPLTFPVKLSATSTMSRIAPFVHVMPRMLLTWQLVALKANVELPTVPTYEQLVPLP